MANRGALAAGIVLFILAAIGFIYPINEIGHSAIQLNDLCQSGFGQIGQFFSRDAQENCRILNYVSLGIYGFGIVGLVLIIVGSVVPSSKKEKTMTCPYCNYVTTSDADLLKHKTDNHLDKSPFKCAHCDFIGITEEVLWNHYNDQHPGKKK